MHKCHKITQGSCYLQYYCCFCKSLGLYKVNKLCYISSGSSENWKSPDVLTLSPLVKDRLCCPSRKLAGIIVIQVSAKKEQYFFKFVGFTLFCLCSHFSLLCCRVWCSEFCLFLFGPCAQIRKYMCYLHQKVGELIFFFNVYVQEEKKEKSPCRL